MFNKIKKSYIETLHISKITGVNRKKVRILISVILSNINVLADVLIILFFANLLVGESTSYTFLNDILNNLYLLPFLIVVRFINNFLQAANILNLQLTVQSNLKDYLITEVYKKGNYSQADATFLINTLSGHIGYFYGALTGVINALIQVIVYSVFLFATNLETISLFFIGALLLAFPTKYLLSKGRKYMHIAWTEGRTANKDIQRVIQNIFLIKILGTSKYEIDRFNKTVKKLQSANEKNQNFALVNSALPNFATGFVISTLIIFTNILSSLTLEFLGITLRLVQTIGQMNKSLGQLINSHVHLEKFINLEQNKLILHENYYKIHESDTDSVVFTNLSFKYFNADEYIFENLDLKIPKNKHTVVTGPNGSGKSTLLGLIANVFYPQEGQIQISSSKIGYVGVTPLIIEDTLRANFMYGNKQNIKDEAIIELAKEFELFKGQEINLNLEVSSRSLSSGQMQKIAFIRALLSDIDILLLDESTSNLDIETKQLIFEILKKKKITIINSTHNYLDFTFDFHMRIVYKNQKRQILIN
jgi:ATP-binding cassette, subfamily B, bacterial